MEVTQVHQMRERERRKWSLIVPDQMILCRENCIGAQKYPSLSFVPADHRELLFEAKMGEYFDCASVHAFHVPRCVADLLQQHSSSSSGASKMGLSNTIIHDGRRKKIGKKKKDEKKREPNSGSYFDPFCLANIFSRRSIHRKNGEKGIRDENDTQKEAKRRRKKKKEEEKGWERLNPLHKIGSPSFCSRLPAVGHVSRAAG